MAGLSDDDWRSGVAFDLRTLFKQTLHIDQILVVPFRDVFVVLGHVRALALGVEDLKLAELDARWLDLWQR